MNTRRAAACCRSSLLSCARAARAAEKPQINVQEFTLAQRHALAALRAPRLAHHRRGLGGPRRLGERARRASPGISHLFEHMMFKGTRVIGTKDIEADLQIIEEQEKVRERDARRARGACASACAGARSTTCAKPENQTAALPRAGEAVRRAGAAAARDRSSRTTWTRSTRKNGGEGLNAGTSEDLTVYFVRLPAQPPRAVVLAGVGPPAEPRLPRVLLASATWSTRSAGMRTESTPLGKFDEAFNALFWEAHPYKWPVVGWASDIPAITKAQADEYFGDLLRAQQPDRRAGRRLQDRRGAAAARALLRPHPARARPSRRRW